MFTTACRHRSHQHHLIRRTIALILRRQTHSRALPKSQRRMVLIRYVRGSRPLAGGSRPVAEGASPAAPGSFGNDSGQPERELQVVGTLPLARRCLAELVTIGVQKLRSWPTGSTSAVSEGTYYSGGIGYAGGALTFSSVCSKTLSVPNTRCHNCMCCCCCGSCWQRAVALWHADRADILHARYRWSRR